MGVASQIVYISVAGYPVDKKFGAVYGLTSILIEWIIFTIVFIALFNSTSSQSIANLI
jgi:hypothetical protein